MGWLHRARRAVQAGTGLLAGGHGNGSKKGEKRPAPRRVWGFEPLEARLVLSLAPGLVPVGDAPTGTLEGKIVYVSGGHGWEFKSGGWTTDRPNLHSMIEPFGAQDQLTYYADYLLRAGATVVPMRPVGRQVNEVVVDNDLSNNPNPSIGTVTWSGPWSNHTPTGASRWYDADYGATPDSVYYRFANVNASSETSVATYTPNIPQAGFYPVYTWASSGGNRTNQLYRINHTGGATEIRVDHRLVGHGWVYLGTYHFDAGTSPSRGSVQISNYSPHGGSVVIADAIRFGNGMGDLPMGSGGIGTGTLSGQPREDEASLLWTYRGLGQGASHSSVLGTSNVSAPIRMAAHMNSSPYGTSVYIGIHSNAFNGNARGTVGLVHSSNPTPNQGALATFTARQIQTDMQALGGQFEHNWASRNHTLAGSYGEISNAWASGQFDATIIEVAFHDNQQDAEMMRDPKGRDQMGRSLYEATLEYFRHVSSPQPANITLPSAPRDVSVVSSGEGEVTVSWAAGPVGGGVAGVHGNAATGFRIYASANGYGFDGGTLVSGGSTTSVTLAGYDPELPYYFRVAAVNAGGESKPSEVLTVLPSGGEKQVLIVNGFDRQDRLQNFQYTSLPPRNTGVSDRVWPRYNNSFDYVVQVHSAIHAARPGIHVDSTSNEAVISGQVDLNDYHSVIWIFGTQGGGSLPGALNANPTFNATEQTKVQQFIAGGGNLFVSGSDIALHLDAQNNGRAFYRNTLGSTYAANNANTYSANAAGGGIFAGMSSFAFSNGAAFSSLNGQVYNVNSADVLSPQSGSVVALNYANGAGAAAIQKQGTGGAGNVVVLGFPFEAMTNATRRTQAMERVLDFFAVEVIVPGNPAISIQKLLNGQEADVLPGPDLAVGLSATFTYLVTNQGDVPLANIVVVDNNGTPGNPADDFNPTFVGGDDNGNGLLDEGETWTYTASHTVTAGQHSSLATVSGEFGSQTLLDSHPVHYVGVTPGIGLQKLVDGQAADSPPGPTLEAGSSVMLLYMVTNTGNVALENVSVLDDNGTPGNPADDFNPVLAGGDTNENGLLDPWETWFYVYDQTVAEGPHHSTATASGAAGGMTVLFDVQAYYVGEAAVVENADFSGSGVVDAGDYVLWRKHVGTTEGATPAQGDANGDGAVDGEDYDIWRAQFGSSPGAGTAQALQATAFDLLDEQADAAGPLPADQAAVPLRIKHIASAAAATDRDALFSLLGASLHELRGAKPAAELEQRLAAHAERPGWELLLARLAERRVERDAPPQALARLADSEALAVETLEPFDLSLGERLRPVVAPRW